MQLTVFPPVDGARVLLSSNFFPHFQEEILNFHGNWGFQQDRDLIFNDGFPRLRPPLQATQSSATTCLTNYSSDVKGEGRSKDWGRNFSFPKCLRKCFRRDRISVRCCQNQKMHRCNSPFWNGFAVCPPSTPHLLTATAGKIPNTRRKSMCASDQKQPLPNHVSLQFL